MTLQAYNYAPNTPADELGQFDYLEYKESGRESFSTGNSAATRVFIVNWDYRPDFINDLLGYSYLQGTTLNRVLPDEHPEIANFFALDASVEGFGKLDKTDNGSISWTCAKITANYKPCDFAVSADEDISTELDRFVTRQYGITGDYLTINGQMKFCTSGQVIANPPGKITGSMQLNYTWHEVPAKSSNPFRPPNLQSIQACLGKVNSVAFDVNGGNYDPQTVLFVGVDPKMITPKLTGDDFHWEITFNFVVRDNGAGRFGDTAAGHNYIYYQPTGIWDLVTSDGKPTGNRIYQTADLNSLFTIDP